jgi:hypothetical protein
MTCSAREILGKGKKIRVYQQCTTSSSSQIREKILNPEMAIEHTN